jgi:hypothetical protein
MKVGNKVEVILSKDWVMVLEIQKNDSTHDRILCRTKDLREIWFYDFELKTL